MSQLERIILQIEERELGHAKSLLHTLKQDQKYENQELKITIQLLEIRIKRLENEPINLLEELKVLIHHHPHLVLENLILYELELAHLLYYGGDYKDALEHIMKIDTLPYSTNYPLDNLLEFEFYDVLTKIYIKLNKFNQAKATLNKSYDMLDREPNWAYESRYYLNQGRIEFVYGSMTNARKWFESALKLCIDKNDKLLKGRCYVDLASVALAQEDLKSSGEYWKQAIEIFTKAENSYYLSTSLYGIIRVYLNLNDKKNYNEYFKLLSNLSWEAENLDNKRVQSVKKISYALIKMQNSRLKDIVLAENHFKEIITADFEHQFVIESMVRLGDILLFEFKLFENDEIKEEIDQLASLLEEIAGKSRSAMIVIYALMLRGNLAAATGDYVGAEKIFIEAQNIAFQRDIKLLHSQILEELDNIEDDVRKLQKLLDQNSKIARNMTKNEIDSYLDSVRKSLM